MSHPISEEQPTPSPYPLFAQRIAAASIPERLTLLWPSIIAMLLAVVACIFYIRYENNAADKREAALQQLASTLPNPQTISSIKDQIEHLKSLIPPERLVDQSKICTVAGRNPDGTNHLICLNNTLPSGGPSGSDTINNINLSLDELNKNALLARQAIHIISITENDSWGVAYADTSDDAFPSKQDRSFMLYTVFTALVVMTIGCFATMLFSTNARAVTYSIDALKFFGGLYAGIVGSVFGIRK
jgi:hypothetical protein